jgi:hypothetical protein
VRLNPQRLAAVTAALGVAVFCGGAGPAAPATASNPPHWWEIGAGILAIPTAILGLVYSYALIRKTNLEVRKTELENRKLEREVIGREKDYGIQQDAEFGDQILAILRPSIESRTGTLLMVRFIVFVMITSMIGMLDSVFEFAATAAIALVATIVPHAEENWGLLVPLALIRNFPRIASAIIIIFFGLPLFRDANRFLGIEFGLKLPPRRWAAKRANDHPK